MSNKDLDDVVKQYLGDNFDFGFTTVSQEEYDKKEVDAQLTLKERLDKIESLVMPLLSNLYKDDNEYIYWPNRKEPIEKLIKDFLQLTRG